MCVCVCVADRQAERQRDGRVKSINGETDEEKGAEKKRRRERGGLLQSVRKGKKGRAQRAEILTKLLIVLEFS